MVPWDAMFWRQPGVTRLYHVLMCQNCLTHSLFISLRDVLLHFDCLGDTLIRTALSALKSVTCPLRTKSLCISVLFCHVSLTSEAWAQAITNQYVSFSIHLCRCHFELFQNFFLKVRAVPGSVKLWVPGTGQAELESCPVGYRGNETDRPA